MDLIRSTLPTLSLKEWETLELEIQTLKKYLPEYTEYLEKKRVLKEAADGERKRIADAAKDPMHQLARLLHAGHVHYMEADDEPLTYKQFVEEKERRARAVASRPERYIKAIEYLRGEIAKQYESAVAEDARADSFVRTAIPETASIKSLVELMKSKGWKGYSGKKADELRGLIAKEEDRQIEVYHNHAIYIRNSADETSERLDLMIKYHTMLPEDLTKEEERVRVAKAAEQVRINTVKAAVAAMRHEKKHFTEINEYIASENKKTLLFEKEYKPIEYFIRDARKYQADGSFPALTSACSNVGGVFLF
jgi:sRNA-binding carbon storage regulator CsrA